MTVAKIMTTTLACKALILWLAILVLAVANGLLRESVLMPLLSSPAALILSGVLLSVLILAVAYLSLPWLQPMAPAQYWMVGVGWLV